MPRLNWSLPLLIALLPGLTACAPIRGVREEVETLVHERYEKSLRKDMERMAKDTRHVYRLDYVITDEWMPALLATAAQFRPLPNQQFDMAPWLQTNGVQASTVGSAIYDGGKRTITVVDTGPNAAIAAKMIEPLHPTHYARIKSLPAPKR